MSRRQLSIKLHQSHWRRVGRQCRTLNIVACSSGGKAVPSITVLELKIIIFWHSPGVALGTRKAMERREFITLLGALPFLTCRGPRADIHLIDCDVRYRPIVDFGRPLPATFSE